MSKVARKFRRRFLLSILIMLLGLEASHYYWPRPKYSDEFLRSLKGPISYDHPELIQFVKNEVLEPPSKKRYNFSNLAISKLIVNKSVLFYRKYLKELFKSKRGGFFVEAGAMDGESMSNTLWLESQQGWNGLLVEPDPANYVALKSKNRKAWSTKTCLSVEKFPKVERLSFLVNDADEISDPRKRANTRIEEIKSNENLPTDVFSTSYYNQQCIPLGTFLLALNVTTVDLLSLDVENVEEKILKNFDFDRFNIKVLFVEWWDNSTLSWLQDFMTSKGYALVAKDIEDIIFVKKNSDYHKIIVEKYPQRRMTSWSE